MRLPALLVLASAPWLALAAGCVDGATPDCTKPNSGCVVALTDASATDASDASVPDASDSDATDAAADAPKADGGDAGDAKTD